MMAGYDFGKLIDKYFGESEDEESESKGSSSKSYLVPIGIAAVVTLGGIGYMFYQRSVINEQREYISSLEEQVKKNAQPPARPKVEPRAPPPPQARRAPAAPKPAKPPVDVDKSGINEDF